MKTLEELTNARFSVRKFKDEPVPEDLITEILEVAQNAPTACNKQPEIIYVVSSESGKAKVKASTQCHFNAPAFFVVCYDKALSWHRDYDGWDYGQVDCAIIMTQMMLRMTELGLGSCFVGWFNPAKLKEQFALSENLIPVGILPFGYPADDVEPRGMHFDNKSIDQISRRI